MSGPLRVAILGSTGSIGRQALEVAAAHPGSIRVVALAAYSSASLVAEQARAFSVSDVALGSPEAARELETGLRRQGDPFSSVGSGPAAIEEIAARDDVDIVLNALVGAAGLRATVATLRAGSTLALANKESLVAGGEFVMGLARPGQILPVDSEHSAIFQCLLGEDPEAVSQLWLTASGGPFRGRSKDDLASVSASDALAHPTWLMGPKITIDSATLMNKGLEVIEAHHLFGVDYDNIKVVVHPQSCIHSMVEYVDGSVKAHLGTTDMRIPIQYALSHPARWSAPVEPVDFTNLGSLDFEPPDLTVFPCLRLAVEAGRAGGTLPAVLNAANEIAVEAFLKGRCGFMDIPRVVESVLSSQAPDPIESLQHLEYVDGAARSAAESLL